MTDYFAHSLSTLETTLLVCLIVGGVAAQLLLKKAAMRLCFTGEVKYIILSLLHNWALFAGLGLMMLDTVMLVWLLRTQPLTYIMPMLALVYVFVPIGACYFFGERVNGFFGLGVALLVFGIALIHF